MKAKNRDEYDEWMGDLIAWAELSQKQLEFGDYTEDTLLPLLIARDLAYIMAHDYVAENITNPFIQ